MKTSPRISSFTIIVTFLCLALAGVAFLPLLPIKLSPSRTLPKLSIRYNMPGNSARVIEMEATSRLEAMLARIKGIKEISSTSGNGWGMITLELDKHTDPDMARFEASTIIRQTWPQLPDELDYPVLQMSRPDDKEARPFMIYTLNASASPIFIQRFAEEQIKPRLSGIPGVSRIDITGATPMEWQLEYDSQQLSRLGITVDDLRSAILQYEQKEFLGLANLTMTGGEYSESMRGWGTESEICGGTGWGSGIKPVTESGMGSPTKLVMATESATGCRDVACNVSTGESLGESLGEPFGKSLGEPSPKQSASATAIASPPPHGEWVRMALVPEPGVKGLDPARITVKNKDGKLIRLDQLVRVTRQEEAPQNYYRINGLNSIYLAIQATETANQLQLARLVKQEMNQILPLLPAGYRIHTSYDATEYIQEELNKIYIRTGLTVLILLIFVLLITRNMRYLFLIVVSLSINLCIAIIFFYLLGLEMQLYSLAGVTISLSLVIDNTIVMTDHIRNRHDKKAFLAILTATLTTIGALVIIFFLDEKIRLNLQDFAAVVIVNLAVSLAVALWLVPAMIDKLGLEYKRPKTRPSEKQAVSPGTSPATRPRIRRNIHRNMLRALHRFPVYFSRYYDRQIRFLCRWKKTACLLLLLAFGIPVFLLPDKIDPEDRKDKREAEKRSHLHDPSRFQKQYDLLDSLFVVTYNRLIDNNTYKETIKPVLDKALGGTLRLFIEKVYQGSYFTRNDETVLSVSATLPNGSTLPQMNRLIGRMETFLSTCDGIRQFQTSIYNAREAGIHIYFTRESERSGYPYTLKSQIISKALELGGGSWNVWGLQDQGFSNDVREQAGNSRIEMYGYNYDELYEWAEKVKAELLTYRRIKEVSINSEFSWWKEDYQEFYFRLDKEAMARRNLPAIDLFASLHSVFGKDLYSGRIVTDGEAENLKLGSHQAQEYDIWSMQYRPLQTASAQVYKLSDLATVGKEQAPQKVAKINQQYRLCLQYEYIGASSQATKIQERVIKKFNRLFPMGYTAKASANFWSWTQEDTGQYALLLLIIAIIFFTTSILFNSLRQPLSVIFVIPISYIGVFLTFYWFKLNFDQGGFASFVLLCGITVNASIYILNEYNRLRDRYPRLPSRRAYLKAWNAKITPIFLTVISTILGFIPFMLGPDKEAFWFPLAAGTIGGLVMSILGIFVFLPIFTVKREDAK